MHHQLVPPAEIILVDDGSKTPPSIKDCPKVRYVRIDHTANLSKVLNTGMDLVRTPWWLDTAPDLIHSPNFISWSLAKMADLINKNSSPPGWMIIPNWFGIKSPDDIPDRVDIKKIQVEEIVTDSHAGIAPPCCGLRDAATWQKLGYNEGFVGWGGYDVDANYRFWLAGGRFYTSPHIAVYHINHPKWPGWMDLILASQGLGGKYGQYYIDHNVSYLDKEMRKGKFI
jgi:glycosyltransferase involved in cell wall biosynthesis